MRGLNSFVDTDFVLNILSPHKAVAQKRYLDLIYLVGDDSNSAMDQEVIKLKYYFKDVSPDRTCINNHFEEPLPHNTRNTLTNIFDSLNLDEHTKKLLLSGSKKTSLTSYKLLFIKEALKSKYTLNEISEFLNVKRNAISMFLSRHNLQIYNL
jgi:predicted DNA-binding protein YlxM (UPF0122 family)